MAELMKTLIITIDLIGLINRLQNSGVLELCWDCILWTLAQNFFMKMSMKKRKKVLCGMGMVWRRRCLFFIPFRGEENCEYCRRSTPTCFGCGWWCKFNNLSIFIFVMLILLQLFCSSFLLSSLSYNYNNNNLIMIFVFQVHCDLQFMVSGNTS